MFYTYVIRHCMNVCMPSNLNITPHVYRKPPNILIRKHILVGLHFGGGGESYIYFDGNE